jgi:MFS family permease
VEREPIFTKDFIFIVLGNFMSSMNFYLLMTSLTVYASTKFHASQGTGGLIVNVFIIGALVARVLAGQLMDKVGWKRMMICANMVSVMLMGFYMLADSIALLVLLRFFHGVSYALANTTFVTAAISGFPESRRGEGNGYFAISIALATAFGPSVALYVVDHMGYIALFATCMICHTLSAILASLTHTKPPAPDAGEKVEKTKKAFSIWNLIEKKAVPVSIVMLVSGVAFSSILSYLNAYAITANLTKAVSIFFITYAVFLLVSRPAAGKLYDVRGENVVVISAYAIFSATFILIVFTHSLILYALAGMFLAFGYGSLMPAIQSVAVKVSPPSHVGMAISTYYICLDTGTGFGGYLMGVIADMLGFKGMYLLTSALLLLMIPTYWLVHGRGARFKHQ